MSLPHTGVDAREYRLFRSLDVQNIGEVLVGDLLEALAAVGLSSDDTRLHEMIAELNRRALRETLDYDQFCDLIRPNILLVEKALQGNMVVPDFALFCQEIERIYQHVGQDDSGQVADYIPQLARVAPDQLAVAVCTVDGQRFAVGDTNVDFSIQSCCKPLNYCLALEEHGDKGVHRYVGREPSGRNFNELTLNDEGKPHNPMINAGAIMCSSLIRPEDENADRFDYVLDAWKAMSGGRRAHFNNSIYQSERETADRNFALGYYMKEHRAFPENTDLLKTLDFYFQCCSLEADAELMSVLAATLANGGVCPTNGERVVKTPHVQHCLSLMCSCGMYDFSGEFSFEVGLPAKSGVGGAIMVAIPNVMGLCVWSPRLDSHGNSARGVEFCMQLVQKFNLHNFDSLTVESNKTDPRLNHIQAKAETVAELIWAASKGDLGAIHRQLVRGYDQNGADYDLRTPMHLASAEGQQHIVEYLVDNGAEVNPRDRWGGTPLDDACRHGHEQVAKLLEDSGGIRGSTTLQGQGGGGNAPALSDSVHRQPEQIVELIYASSEDDLVAIQRLVARGIDLEAADYDLRTPLHLAAAEGRERIVQYFLDQGVDRSPLDRWDSTPLDEAQRHGHTRVVELLKSDPVPQ